MNKHNSSSILNTFFLIAVALSSGCGAVTATPSLTLTTSPYQKPMTSVILPTSTTESIQPKGIFIYSDNSNTYALDLESRKITTIISKGNTAYIYPVLDKNNLYFLQSPQNSTTKQQNQILKVKIDGKDLEQLTFDNNGYEKSELSGSSSGKYLTYVENGNTYSIVLYDKSTGKSKTIIHDSEFDFHLPSISPDDKYIAFFREIKNDPRSSVAIKIGHLFVYSIADGRTIDPIPEKDSPIFLPSWSPDGRKLETNISLDLMHTNIAILNLNNTLTNQSIEINYYNASGRGSWSPDGNKILFNNIMYMFILESDSGKTNLIPTGEQRIAGYTGVWSPDGNLIAYITSAGSGAIPNPSILNIQSIETGQTIQFQIPGEGWINCVSWLTP